MNPKFTDTKVSLNNDENFSKDDIDLALKTILLLIEWDFEDKQSEIMKKEAA